MVGHPESRESGFLAALLDPVYVSLQSKCANIRPLIILPITLHRDHKYEVLKGALVSTVIFLPIREVNAGSSATICFAHLLGNL